MAKTRSIEWHRLDWPVVIGIGSVHILCILAPFYFSWSALFVAVFLAWLTGGIGIALCYHRLLTHRSFKTHKWFEYLLAIIGCLAWQGGPAQWVGIHRLHHAHPDGDEDPHTPNHGFAWAHMLWCLHKDEGGKRGVEAAKDLLRDRGLRFINRYFWVFQFGLIPLLFCGGWAANSFLGWSTSGMSWVIWGIGVRTVAVYHTTWFINSAAHTWGYQNYKTGDRSKNTWWLAPLSFFCGENWHNNHHAHQRSAAHGLKWYEIDITYRIIRLFGLLKLAWDIKLPKPEEMPE